MGRKFNHELNGRFKIASNDGYLYSALSLRKICLKPVYVPFITSDTV